MIVCGMLVENVHLLHPWRDLKTFAIAHLLPRGGHQDYMPNGIHYSRSNLARCKVA
jgi:hypothetical protein